MSTCILTFEMKDAFALPELVPNARWTSLSEYGQAPVRCYDKQRTVTVNDLELSGMGLREKTQDHVLVRQCMAGSQEAWQELYSRYANLMRSVVRRRGVGQTDSEDIVQSSFLALTTALNSFNQGTSLAHFICMITERVLIDELRKGKAAKRSAETLPVAHHDGDEESAMMIKSDADPQDRQMEKAEQAVQLKTALDKLDPKCRELLTLRFYRELSFGEMAEMLGSSENTLTVQTRRCLDKLKAVFNGKEPRGSKK
jgi:RNA polymerase sigma factor (sigma-70 family)